MADKIIATYHRFIPVSDPEGPDILVQTVMVIWVSNKLRYEIWGVNVGERPVEGFPHSIYPPKLFDFLKDKGFYSEGKCEWSGTPIHGVSMSIGHTGGSHKKPVKNADIGNIIPTL